MIVVRAPLRITLGGGGTDVPAYYREHGGFCLSAAIDQYVYVTVLRPFAPGLYLKYSEIEHVATAAEVQHPILRDVLGMTDERQIEITALADIPAGTGLGSSSAFTVALLKALRTHQRCLLSSRELAELACRVEIEHLGAPIGKQDQYSAVYGGVNAFRFQTDGSVVVTPVQMYPDTLSALEDHLLLFYTGITRSANVVLRGGFNWDSMDAAKSLGVAALRALQDGDLEAFARTLSVQWEIKRTRFKMTNNAIDGWYDLGIKAGAMGGKLVGAGGGGFLLFYTEQPKRLRAAMREAGLPEVRFRFDWQGAQVLVR